MRPVFIPPAPSKPSPYCQLSYAVIIQIAQSCKQSCQIHHHWKSAGPFCSLAIDLDCGGFLPNHHDSEIEYATAPLSIPPPMASSPEKPLLPAQFMPSPSRIAQDFATDLPKVYQNRKSVGPAIDSWLWILPKPLRFMNRNMHCASIRTHGIIASKPLLPAQLCRHHPDRPRFCKQSCQKFITIGKA